MIDVNINLDVDFFEKIKNNVLAEAQEAIVNEIVFLVSLYYILLLMHRNAINFYILILYPGTLLNLF